MKYDRYQNQSSPDTVTFQVRDGTSAKSCTISGTGLLPSDTPKAIIARWDGTEIHVQVGATSNSLAYDGASLGVPNANNFFFGGAFLGTDYHQGLLYGMALYDVDVGGANSYDTALLAALLADPLLPIRPVPVEAHNPYLFDPTFDGLTLQLPQDRDGATQSEIRVLHAVDDATLSSSPTVRDPVVASAAGSGTPIVLKDVISGLTADQRFKVEYRVETGTGDWVTLGKYGRTDTERIGNLYLRPGDQDAVKIAVYADVHMNDQTRWTRWAKSSASMQSKSAKLLVHMGDRKFGDGGVASNADAYDLDGFTRLSWDDLLLYAPHISVVGNHENVGSYQSTAAYRRASMPLFWPTTDRAEVGTVANDYWSVRFGLIELFIIDHYPYTGTSVPDNEHRIMSETQKDYIAEAIAQSGAPYRGVLSHQLLGGYDSYGRGFGDDIYAAGDLGGDTYMESALWPAI